MEIFFGLNESNIIQKVMNSEGHLEEYLSEYSSKYYLRENWHFMLINIECCRNELPPPSHPCTQLKPPYSPHKLEYQESLQEKVSEFKNIIIPENRSKQKPNFGNFFSFAQK